MKKLTKMAEELLLEVFEHRDNRGVCDGQYWQKRFESLSSADDAMLRSFFKELREADMISIQWADDYPNNLFILANGAAYFNEMQAEHDSLDQGNPINIFYGPANGIQIQQGTHNSAQTQTITTPFDEQKINNLIQTILQYNDSLNDEYGDENAENLRNAVDELSTAINEEHDTVKAKGLLEKIRELSVNAVGSLIANGIIKLISEIMIIV